MKEMKRILRLFMVPVLLVAVSCSSGVKASGELKGLPEGMFPDYSEVTVPCNIAPLDFTVGDGEKAFLEIDAPGGGRIAVKSGKYGFRIPLRKWRNLLVASKGGSLQFTVSVLRDGKWLSYEPFKVNVSEYEADPYVAYRLIAPGYGLWNKMGLYQRNITDFKQTPIYENRLTDNNCVNCHSFRMQDPSRMVFHMRAANGGTVFMDGKQIEKLNTKTDKTISNLVYPYWHPEGHYIAFSVNRTFQSFHAADHNRIEVFDAASDVVVMDTEKMEVFSNPELMRDDAFETFPTFSPDGKSLYFCSAPAVDPMPDGYKNVHYNLCRVDFDPITGTVGSRIDTLFHAADSSSASFPRISPDGKTLVFTKHGYGNFSIWHKDADLYAVDLESRSIHPLSEVNAHGVDSYHSWSSNSRFMVFSSRRIDGLYTRLYMTYVDESGQEHKPFLLPQRNPQKYYEDLMFSYNIPEFIKGPVKADRHRIGRTMRTSSGTNLSFRESPVIRR
ncbi:MAG: PD40 domain-containing protein [Bacteroidales bacterium]|nr:PD40 domain-containing protein [Bacteroidales bacterium]